MRDIIARTAARRTVTVTLRRLTATVVVAMTATTAACDRLLDVENPASVPIEALDNPALMQTLEAAAIQQFQCAFANFVATAGMLSGEYWSANGFVNNHPWEWRGVVQIRNEAGSCPGRNATSMGFYTPMQQARFQLDDLFTRASAFTDEQVPNRQRMLTETRAYAGYAFTILGETMCEMTVDGGPRMTSQEVWAIAEERFSEAITLATALGDNSLKNMALAGRARVRLDMGKLSEAAEDARLVPAGFVRDAEFSTVTQTRENRIYNLTVANSNISVTPPYQDLTVDGQPDPRVPVENMNRLGPDNSTPFWRQLKYTAADAPIPIASYAEAQLILAEASSDPTEKLEAINRVRALSDVPAFAGTVTDDVIIEERRRQLFSEGHRYVDMLRKDLPFQSGTNRKGQTYSDLTCVPLPDVETLNNPNFN
ncbi:MAG: RagB/SusD protein [Geminicoccaceae bacterium]|nr:RagB/SusD protein [Geminicoccaceae bacterium]